MSTHSLIRWLEINGDVRVDMPMVGWGTSMDNWFLNLLPECVNCWLPLSARPISLSIPEGHHFYPAMSTLDGDFMAYGFRKYGPKFEEALYSLYNGLDTKRNGRLLQFITAEAYIGNGGDKDGAIHVGRNTFNKLLHEFPNTAD